MGIAKATQKGFHRKVKSLQEVLPVWLGQTNLALRRLERNTGKLVRSVLRRGDISNDISLSDSLKNGSFPRFLKTGKGISVFA